VRPRLTRYTVILPPADTVSQQNLWHKEYIENLEGRRQETTRRPVPKTESAYACAPEMRLVPGHVAVEPGGDTPAEGQNGKCRMNVETVVGRLLDPFQQHQDARQKRRSDNAHARTVARDQGRHPRLQADADPRRIGLVHEGKRVLSLRRVQRFGH